MSSLTLTLSTPAQMGRWCFKNRGWMPLPFILPILILPGTATASGFWICSILVFECLRLWAVGYAGSGTRTRGDVIRELVRSGPYRIIRNPLYVANIGLYSSAAFLFGFMGYGFVVFFISFIHYTLIIAYEEENLLHAFGEIYEKYCELVPRWIPNLQKGCLPSDHKFSLRVALRSERSTLFSLIALLVVFIVRHSVQS